jgi:hypothetical protein
VALAPPSSASIFDTAEATWVSSKLDERADEGTGSGL